VIGGDTREELQVRYLRLALGRQLEALTSRRSQIGNIATLEDCEGNGLFEGELYFFNPYVRADKVGVAFARSLVMPLKRKSTLSDTMQRRVAQGTIRVSDMIGG
jgi:hypothetical protein